MAGLKVFLALYCVVAAVNAVQLERKPFKRLIPADVLRGSFHPPQCDVSGHDVSVLIPTDVLRGRFPGQDGGGPGKLKQPFNWSLKIRTLAAGVMARNSWYNTG